MPSVHRLRRPAAVALCITTLAAVGCGRTDPAATAPAPSPSEPAAPAVDTGGPLRLQLNWFPEPEFGGIYAAQERGLFAAEGLAVEILQGGADVPAGQLLASGKVELAVLAAEQVLTLRAAGGKVKAIFASFQMAPRVILVEESSPHRTLADLWRSEATILAQDGMSFVRWLNRTYPGGKLSFVPYAGSAAPLLAGSVDAMQGFATAEPVQLALDGHPVRVFRVGEEGFDPYDAVISVNETVLAERPDAIHAAVRALAAGWRSYLDDPGPINARMAELNRDMSLAVMNESARLLPGYVESDDTRARGLGAMTAERWETLARQLVELGDLTPPVDAEAAWVDLAAAP